MWDTRREREWEKETNTQWKKPRMECWFYLILGRNEKNIERFYVRTYWKRCVYIGVFPKTCTRVFEMRNSWMELFIISTGSEFKYTRCWRIRGMYKSEKRTKSEFRSEYETFRSTDCLMLTRCSVCSNKFHELKIEIRSDPHGSCISKAKDYHWKWHVDRTDKSNRKPFDYEKHVHLKFGVLFKY